MKKELFEKIFQFKENDFTKIVLIPLFEKMGYDKVIFNGGINENGKDLVCWKLDEIGEKEVVTAQVKMKKLDTSSSGNNSFATAITQLHQASQEKIKNEDGHEYLPSVVYFISPSIVDTRQLNTSFNALNQNTKLKIIDGGKLYWLLDRYIPELVSDLCGNVNKLQKSLIKEVNNDELFSALNVLEKKDAVKYYSNLDINYFSRLIKINSFSTSNRILCIIEKEKWNDFSTFVSNKLSYIPSIGKLINLEGIRKRYIETNNKINLNQIKELKHLYNSLDSSTHRFNSNLEIFTTELNDESKKIVDREKAEEDTSMINFFLDDFNQLKKQIAVLNKNAKRLKEANQSIYEDELKKIDDSLKKSVLGIKKKCQKLEMAILELSVDNLFSELKKTSILMREIIKLKTTTEELIQHHFEFDKNTLQRLINYSLIKKINYIHSEEKFIETIMELNSIFNDFEVLNNLICDVQFNFSYKYNPNQSRIEKHVSDLLDSKLSIFIEGNAGAGKTTTLQHYAFDKESNNCLYLPLSKMNLYFKSDIESNSDNLVDELLNSILLYIDSQGVKLEKGYLLSLLSENETILLFDGLDEVIKKIPWLFDSISTLKETFDCTICITSRPNTIDNYKKFVLIKLMEFNNEQKEKFIKGWFSKDIPKAEHLLKHIEVNNLDSLIKNPLVATIFCSLTEKNVPLPSTETNLYEERFRLLFGDYDIHKNISRTSKHRSDLETISQKIAYFFHKRNLRALNIEKIIEALIAEVGDMYTEEEIENIVNELIMPCNVLFDDFNDGKYTFGHLRYQEFLASKELIKNRGIDIKQYVTNIWWHGVLVLFSKQTAQLDFLIDDIIASDFQIDKNEYILKEMLLVRSDAERKKLSPILDKYIKIGKEDQFFDSFEDFY